MSYANPIAAPAETLFTPGNPLGVLCGALLGAIVIIATQLQPFNDLRDRMAQQASNVTPATSSENAGMERLAPVLTAQAR